MDFLITAGAIIKLLASKGAEEFGKGLGNAAFANAKAAIQSLAEYLRNRPTLSKSMETFEAHPEDAAAQDAIKRSLASEMSRDSDFARGVCEIAAATQATQLINTHFHDTVQKVIQAINSPVGTINM